MTDLKAILEALPDDALVPVRWLRARLGAPAGTPDDRIGDLSCTDVAKVLGRTPGCIRGWCARGEIPGAYRLNGREWRLPAAALRAYLDAHGSKQSGKDAEAVDLGAWRR